MVNYREILRLANQGYSQRQIATSIRSSHHTVKETLEVIAKQGVHWLLDESISNETLMSMLFLLFPSRYETVSGYLEPDFTYIHAELAKPKITLTLLWNKSIHKAESLGKKPYR